IGSTESAVTELEASRDTLSPELPRNEFVRLLDLVEQISAFTGRLAAYAYLWYASDTQDQDALAFRGQVERLLTDVTNRTLFFSLWWKDLDEDAARRLMAASDDNLYYLESLRRFKPHTLSEPEEKVVNLKDVNGIDGLRTVYGMMTNAFTFPIEIEGEVQELTRSELMVYARDPRPELRAVAYQALYGVYREAAPVLGQIYQYVTRDWSSENLQLRKFATPIAVRNLSNDLPDPVVDTLLDVCRDNASLFQRYFRLKAGWLGVDRLRRYDIYAPLSASGKTYPFPEAVHLVLDSMQDFAPAMAGHARRVLAENHLDAEIRPRKDMGAFSYGPLPGMTPWVLMNYTGQVSEVATLAHELGHAVHSMMAADHSPLTFHASLPLAETASVFAEMLLLERLLAVEPDQAVHRDLLARFVDDAYATVMRQAYFVLFEREAHDLVAQGRTTDYLAERYMDNLRDQFGDALELSDEFRWEWTSIPHIYDRPFYCYAYSFGQLLVLALYQRYREEGASFVPDYLRILAYGGSASPAEILEETGIDMASPEFWQGGFDVISGMIDELEALS
ncbi:MAG: M3 family oligoendopeptidase, partial [Anaerolineae bacterium]